MSASRRRPDTGRVPSNRFQIFQHNEADCCPKIPLRAPSFSVSSSPPGLSTPFTLFLSPVSCTFVPLLLTSSPPFILPLWLFYGATKVAPADRFSIRIIVDPTSNVYWKFRFHALLFSSLLLSPLVLFLSFTCFLLSRCHARGLFAHNPSSILWRESDSSGCSFFDWFPRNFARLFSFLEALLRKVTKSELFSNSGNRERQIALRTSYSVNNYHRLALSN